MNDERVFQLLMETNPVPDPDALDSPLALAQLERRSPTMATDIQSTTERATTRPVRDPNRRSRLLIGAAAAVLVLIVGLGTWAAIGGGRDAALEPEVNVVLSAIEAQNRGDIDAYKANLSGEELVIESRSNLSAALSYANRTTELVDCRVTGTATGKSIVECGFTSTDDFYGAGGIVESGTATFLINEDDKITDSGRDDGSGDIPWEETELAMFNFAFWSWLMDAHPSVFDDIGSAPTGLYDIPGLATSQFDPRDPAVMLIAVQFVDEFVAQSDVYPLGQ